MKNLTRFNWNGFGKEFEELVNKIHQIFADSTSEMCIVSNVPIDDQNKSFLSIAEGLGGEILRDRRMPKHSMESDSRIYRVEEDPLNTDQYAHSATNEHFSLHTDCAHSLHPPELMMLLTCQPSSTGGQTILVHIDEILSKLTDQMKSDLSQIEFPWWRGSINVCAPILTKRNKNDQWLIRFNESTLRRETELNSSVQSLLDILKSFEQDPNHQLTLSSGDLLIVHNQRILHGRTAFPSNSQRLLKRLRMRCETIG